ncbi:MBL fold metallo-hydrolase [Pseudonocardia humida]|uniref:MBL fold metallo-hydrolase n=1 Tax=Pseudonocardia humida TaxID=2800819 RepID=A0ABT1A042_9PSEU|nr:MBL fold metallo-hydrolase [Pseudonocardia humida]MCO1656371.1 MBL fold metallo-hydrolase [Pseudonocardia humida]
MRLTHVGGPTLLIEVGGWRLLTDPTFDPPGRRYAFGWGTSSVKTAGPAVPAAEIGRVDAVLLTHDHHGDNLDDAGRALLASAGTVVTTRSGARRLAGSGAVDPGRVVGLAAGSTTVLDAPGRAAIEVTATPCRHGPPLSRAIVGDVVGFALGGGAALWITGDTVLHRELLDVAGRLRVDVAVPHLGGVRFPVTGPVRYSMTARDAVRLCEVLRPRAVVPVHYEGWSHFAQGRRAAEEQFARAPRELRDALRWLDPGVPTDPEVS